MISSQSIDEVKMRIDIVDVISDYVSLKKAGTNFKALSPFTDEKTPSFFVSPSKGIYKCFSSGKGGDAIDFLEEHEGMTYLEAIRHLAKKYGVDLEETSSDQDDQTRSEREALYIVLGFARDLYRELLMDHAEGKKIGLDYFRERGLNTATIEKFELGYALDKWDHLLKTAKEKGHSEELLEKAGLIIKKDDGKIYDRFRGRTIFPVHDISGRVIAFGARILGNEKNQPKYINSPETEVYTKSKVLYGLFQAKREIRNKNNCYLVEGYTDVLSLHQSGFTNVVASSGTALTDDQIRLINRYTDSITMLFDGDRAGVEASMRGVDMILEKGLNVRIVMFPDGEDPDSYLRKVGSTAFEDYLFNEKKDFVTFKAAYFADKVGDDASAKATAIREIVGSIAKIPDPMKRAIYLKESSGIFEIDEAILVSEANRMIIERRKQSRSRRQVDDLPPLPVTEHEEEPTARSIDEVIKDQERECLRILVNYGNESQLEFGFYHKYFFTETEGLEYLDNTVGKMISLYQKEIEKGKPVDVETFIDEDDDEVRDLAADLFFEKYTISENWKLKHNITVLHETEMLDLVFQRNLLLLKYRKVTKTLEEEMRKLKEATQPSEQDEIMEHFRLYKQYHTEYARELGIIIDN